MIYFDSDLNKFVVVNAYGLNGFFDTYKEAADFYKESIENCIGED